jgi:hypothetical protein
MLNPLSSIPAGVDIMNGLVVGLCFISVDALLLCRVFAVVPPSRTSWSVLTAVYTFPILNKVARLVILVVYCVQYMRDARLHPLIGAQSFDTTKNQVILYESIWFLTAADNASVNSLRFFWPPRPDLFLQIRVRDLLVETARQRIQKTKSWSCNRRQSRLAGPERSRSCLTKAGSDSFGSQIRTLFWLCGTNFIFPGELSDMTQYWVADSGQ